MTLFECRHAEWHDDHDWHQVKAFDAISAATNYAEYLDGQDSESFMDPEQPQPVFVREVGRPDVLHRFVITFDYYKSFTARRERTAQQKQIESPTS